MFNISAFRSSGNSPVDITGSLSVDGAAYDAATGVYTANGTDVTLYKGDVNQEVNSLYFGMNFSEAVVGYDIQITDDGNAAAAYGMSTQYLLQWLDQSRYMTVHPYGKVHTMKLIFHVTPGTTFSIQSVALNPVRTVHVRLPRLLLLYLSFCFFALFRKGSLLHEIPLLISEEQGNRTGRWMRRCGMGLFLLVGVIVVSVMCLKFGSPWKNTAYVTEYADLAHSLAHGSFQLEYKVADSLKAMENPYDYSVRMANGVEAVWDSVYYNGAYYCYFGVTPVVITYLPYFLITGQDLNNVYAAWFFSVLIFMGSTWLVYEMLRRYFPKVPFYTWPLFSIFVGFSVNLVYLYQRPDFYDIPILAGNAFAVIGLSCWLHAVNMEEQRAEHWGVWLVLGSLSMALVAGCRPQMELMAFLAIPVFWSLVFDARKLFSTKSIGRTAAFLLPFVVIATCLMYYNAARFGSPFDFGANYNLTTNDMTRRGFNLDRLGCGLVTFLIQPPLLIATYPFVQRCMVSSQYMGKLIVENLFGGIFLTNLVTLFSLGYFQVKFALQKKQMRLFVGLSVVLALVLCCVDATAAGILQRYTADFALLLLLPGIMVAGALLEYFWKSHEKCYQVLSAMLCVMAFLLLTYDGMLICLQLGDGSVHKEVMTTFYQVRSWFVLQ